MRLLLADHEEESLTVYTDGFRAYEPLDDDDEVSCEFVVHGDGEYADDEVNVNTSARATGRCCDRGSRPIAGSQRTGSHSISERSSSAANSFGNPEKKRSNTLSEPHSEINNVLHKSGSKKVSEEIHRKVKLFVDGAEASIYTLLYR